MLHCIKNTGLRDLQIIDLCFMQRSNCFGIRAERMCKHSDAAFTSPQFNNLFSLFPYASNSGFLSVVFASTKPTHPSLTRSSLHITPLVSLWMLAHIFGLWQELLHRCFVVSESVWEHTHSELWVVGGKQM